MRKGNADRRMPCQGICRHAVACMHSKESCNSCLACTARDLTNHNLKLSHWYCAHSGRELGQPSEASPLTATAGTGDAEHGASADSPAPASGASQLTNKPPQHAADQKHRNRPERTERAAARCGVMRARRVLCMTSAATAKRGALAHVGSEHPFDFCT